MSSTESTDISQLIDDFRDNNYKSLVLKDLEAGKVIKSIPPSEADKINHQFQQECAKLDEYDIQSMIEMDHIVAGD